MAWTLSRWCGVDPYSRGYLLILCSNLDLCGGTYADIKGRSVVLSLVLAEHTEFFKPIATIHPINKVYKIILL